MRDCGITDERLFGFVDGFEDMSLDEHVAGCDECQAFLAELWIGEAPRDLREPVMRRILFEEFLREATRLGLDVFAAMGRAVVELGPGADLRSDERGEADDE